VIGLGSHFIKNIYPALKNNNYIKFTSGFSPSKINQKTFKGIKIFKDLDTFIKEKEIKYYYISNYTSLHYKTCLSLLKNHKNIICEKPLVLKLSEFNYLIKLAKKNNLILFEAFMFEFHKNFIAINKLLNSHKIGKIKSINIKFTIPSLNKNNFRYNLSKGGGAFFDLGCYTVKMASLLVKSKIEKILGYKIYDSRKIDISGNVLLHYKNNISCVLEWGFESSYNNIMIINTDKYLIEVNKIFSKKTNETTYITIKSNNSNTRKVISADNHFENMFMYFIKISRNKKMKKIYFDELIEYQNIFFKVNNRLLK